MIEIGVHNVFLFFFKVYITWDRNSNIAIWFLINYLCVSLFEWITNSWGHKWSRSSNCHISINSTYFADRFKFWIRYWRKKITSNWFVHKAPLIMIQTNDLLPIWDKSFIYMKLYLTNATSKIKHVKRFLILVVNDLPYLTLSYQALS